MRLTQFFKLLAFIPALIIEILITTAIVLFWMVLTNNIEIDPHDAVERSFVLVPIAIWAIQFVGFLIITGVIPKERTPRYQFYI